MLNYYYYTSPTTRTLDAQDPVVLLTSGAVSSIIYNGFGVAIVGILSDKPIEKLPPEVTECTKETMRVLEKNTSLTRATAGVKFDSVWFTTRFENQTQLGEPNGNN